MARKKRHGETRDTRTDTDERRENSPTFQRREISRGEVGTEACPFSLFLYSFFLFLLSFPPFKPLPFLVVLPACFLRTFVSLSILTERSQERGTTLDCLDCMAIPVFPTSPAAFPYVWLVLLQDFASPRPLFPPLRLAGPGGFSQHRLGRGGCEPTRHRLTIDL